MADNGPLPGLDVIRQVAAAVGFPMNGSLEAAQQMWDANVPAIVQYANQMRLKVRDLTEMQRNVRTAGDNMSTQLQGQTASAVEQQHARAMAALDNNINFLGTIITTLDRTAADIDGTRNAAAQLTVSIAAQLRSAFAGGGPH